MNTATLSYASYATPVTFSLANTSGATMGVGTTYSGITAVTGSANNGAGAAGDTITGTVQTYTLDNAIANKGSNGTVTWTSIENLTDSGAGIFKMGTGGSVTGNLTAVGGTLNYSSYTTPVAINQQTTTATGITAFSGIGAVVGNGATTTITGLNAGETFNVTSPDAGTAGALVFTGVGRLTGGTGDDSFTLSGGGTLSGAIVGGLGVNTLAGSTTYVVTGANSGTATGVTGGFTQIANLTGTTGADTFTFAGGTLSGLMTGGGGVDSLSGTTAGAANFAGGGVSALNIGALTAGSVGVSGTTAITVNGAVNTGAGAVGLTSTGTISEGLGGSITTRTLTTSAVGGTTLGGANAVTNFGATDTGAVSLANTAATLGLNAITSAGLTVNNFGSLALNAASAIAEGASNVTLAANGGNFINNSGSATPITATRWLVYSTSPTLDTPSGMTAANKHYAQAYTGTTPAYAATGNWNLYSVVPVLSVTPSSQAVTYGTVPSSFTPSYTGFLGGDTSTTAGISGTATFGVAGTISTSVNYTAGSHNVSYNSGLASSLGYTFVDNAASIGELTVNKLALAGSIATGSSIYGAALTPGAASFTNAVAGDALGTATVAVNTAGLISTSGHLTAGTHVGIESVSALSGADAGNYTFAAATGNYTVSKLNLAVTGVTATNKVYDGTTAATLGGTAAITALGSDIVTLGGTASGLFADKNVGTGIAITVSGKTISGTDAANYNLVQQTGLTANITRAPLGITANGTSKTYGSTVSFTGSEFSSIGLKNSETVGSVSLASAGAATAAGVTAIPYAITASAATGGNFNAGNYTISYVNGTLGVIPAALGITANSTSKTYGSTVSFTGSEFSSIGLKNNETVGSVSLASTGAAAAAGMAGSPYAITPSSATGTFTPSNYTIGYVNGALTVNPAGLTVTASNASKTYGQTPTLTAFTTAGLLNGETVGSVTETSPGTAAAASVAGSAYVITPSSATGGTFTPSNYTIGYVNSALIVNPASLTVTADNVTKTFGQTLTLSAFTPTGLANGETIGSVTETSAGTAATASVAGSPYAITPSNATGGTFTPSNYTTITYVNGAMAVTPVIQPIPVVVPPVTPPVVVAAETPQVQETVEGTLISSPLIQNSVGSVSGGLAGLNLTVIGAGVRMPPVQLAETPPVQPAPVVVPPEMPPKIYVPPQRPRKPDRN